MLTAVVVLATWTAASSALAIVVGGVVRLRECDGDHVTETAGTDRGATAGASAGFGGPAVD